MHRRGINVRYLGAVRQQLHEVDVHRKDYERERALILTEMVVRYAKNHLRWLLRQTKSVQVRRVCGCGLWDGGGSALG
jgi:hypothetical protein